MILPNIEEVFGLPFLILCMAKTICLLKTETAHSHVLCKFDLLVAKTKFFLHFSCILGG